MDSRPGKRRWIAAALTLILVIASAAFFMGRGNDDVEMQRGLALFSSGAYADAASHFYRYAQANPDEVAPHLYLARIHRHLNRLDLAGPELDEALRLAPENPAVQRELELYVERIQALRQSGQTEASTRILEQAPAEVRARLGGR